MPRRIVEVFANEETWQNEFSPAPVSATFTWPHSVRKETILPRKLDHRGHNMKFSHHTNFKENPNKVFH